MFVIDIETTGLYGLPRDRVLEIGITELSFDGTVRKVYDEVIRYPDMEEFDREYLNKDGEHGCWVFRNSSLTIESVLEAEKNLGTVIGEVRSLLDGGEATSYNVRYDFGMFLAHEPWDLGEYCTVPYDIMEGATRICKEMVYSDEVEDKELQNSLRARWDIQGDRWIGSFDAYRILCPGDPAGLLDGQTHRAADDAFMEAYILKEIIHRF